MLSEIAQKQVLLRRDRHSQIETTDARDFLHATLAVDAIQLSLLPACPKNSFSIEGESFGMVQSRGENFEPIQRNGRSHVAS